MRSTPRSVAAPDEGNADERRGTRKVSRRCVTGPRLGTGQMSAMLCKETDSSRTCEKSRKVDQSCTLFTTVEMPDLSPPYHVESPAPGLNTGFCEAMTFFAFANF